MIHTRLDYSTKDLRTCFGKTDAILELQKNLASSKAAAPVHRSSARTNCYINLQSS